MSIAERLSYQDFAENRTEIESRWDEDFGDRMNEMVFIAQDLQKDELRGQLNACLVTAEEILHYKSGGDFINPFANVIQ
jgi:hypothetical protein